LAPLVEVGRSIFLDTGLSHPPGLGCVSCHQPQSAFADPRPVSPGAVDGRTGKRNAPSLMYAALTSSFYSDELITEDNEKQFIWEGGLFYDGRAKDLFEQVQEPFFDKNELNIPNPGALAASLRKASYGKRFKQAIGDEAWNDDERLLYFAYRALVEFLKEPMFRPFNAPIDDFLAGNKNALTEQELRGMQVFQGPAQCEVCHFLFPTTWPKSLLSDFGYDNLGVPSRGEKDPGLIATTKDPKTRGLFKVPSLRNIALTAPYMHNGSITNLREVLEFYNKRDLEPDRWGPTDYPDTVNREDMGDLKLTEQQIDDLLAFLQTFTDRTVAAMKKTGSPFPQNPKTEPSTDEMREYFPDWSQRYHPAYPGDQATLK